MSRMTCQQAVREFFAYLDRALTGESMDALEEHLRECLDCCDRLQFSRELDTFVKARLDDGTIPDELEARLRQRLRTSLSRTNVEADGRR